MSFSPLPMPTDNAYYVDMDCACEIQGDGTPERPYDLARCQDHCGPERTVADTLGGVALWLICFYFAAHVALAIWTRAWPVHA